MDRAATAATISTALYHASTVTSSARTTSSEPSFVIAEDIVVYITLIAAICRNHGVVNIRADHIGYLVAFGIQDT